MVASSSCTCCHWEYETAQVSVNPIMPLQLGYHIPLCLSLSLCVSLHSLHCNFHSIIRYYAKGNSSVMSCLAALKAKFCISWRKEGSLSSKKIIDWTGECMHACLICFSEDKVVTSQLLKKRMKGRSSSGW